MSRTRSETGTATGEAAVNYQSDLKTKINYSKSGDREAAIRIT